jgi:hypothetical protein
LIFHRFCIQSHYKKAKKNSIEWGKVQWHFNRWQVPEILLTAILKKEKINKIKKNLENKKKTNHLKSNNKINIFNKTIRVILALKLINFFKDFKIKTKIILFIIIILIIAL